jgi:hypothetical protein
MLVVGFLVTWGWSFVVGNDLLHQWRRLPAPPAEPVELVTIWLTKLYVRAPDGQLYTIEPEHIDVWMPVAAITPTDRDHSSDMRPGNRQVSM